MQKIWLIPNWSPERMPSIRTIYTDVWNSVILGDEIWNPYAFQTIARPFFLTWKRTSYWSHGLHYSTSVSIAWNPWKCCIFGAAMMSVLLFMIVAAIFAERRLAQLEGENLNVNIELWDFTFSSNIDRYQTFFFQTFQFTPLTSKFYNKCRWM